MGDVPGLPPTKSVTFINQAVVPDTLPGEGTLYANAAGDLSYKGSNGTVTDLITGGAGGITGSGVAGEVTYWSGTSTVTGTTGFTFNGTALTVPAINLPLDGANLLWGAGNGFGTTVTNAVAIVNNGILTMLWGADNSVTASGAFTVDGASTFNSLATFYGSIFSAGGKFDVSPVLTQEIATPTATPGYGSIYTYTDGNLHYTSPTGTDYALTPPASGGITGSGVSGELTYWNGTSTVTGNSGLTFNGTTLNLSTGGAVQTATLTLTNGGNPALSIGMPGSTTLYSVTMPGAQGTGALTNNGSGTLSWTPSLPLTGGTLTGGLIGTTSEFSSIKIDSSLGPTLGSTTINSLGDISGVAKTLVLPAANGTVGQVLEIGAVSGSQATLTWATPSGGGITALTGDVSASGSGSVAATVNSVGGATAANVANATSKVNAASTAGYVLTANGTAGGATFQPAASATLSTMPASVIINVQNTGSYTVLSTDRGAIITDQGTSVANTYTLPTSPTLGDTYFFSSTLITTSANVLKITCGNAAHLIQLPQGNSTAGAGHGITCNGSGSTRANGSDIMLTYVATNTWRWTGGYPYDWSAY